MALEDMQQNIEHVVILMLENRGLDTVLGWLYEDDGRPDHLIGNAQDDRKYFNGLDQLYQQSPQKENGEKIVPQSLNQAYLEEQVLTGYEPEMVGDMLVDVPVYETHYHPKDFYVTRRGAKAPHSPYVYTHEDHEHVTHQVFGKAFPAEHGSPTEAQAPGPTMNGFAQDYLSNILQHYPGAQHSMRKQTTGIEHIFDVYTPEQLPVLNGLAKHYAVSDEWFCSVPSQTNTNRAFFIAGTSMGLSQNGYLQPKGLPPILADDRFHCKTLWHVLDEAREKDIRLRSQKEITWKHYHFDYHYPTPLQNGPYTYRLFPYLKNLENTTPDNGRNPTIPTDSRFVRIERFWWDAKEGTLPTVSIIEPKWSYSHHTDDTFVRAEGNDYHAPADTTPGEEFVKQVYDAVTRSPSWDKTLLVITFDEHGGTYDHVPPPWGAIPPWGQEDPHEPDAKYNESPQGRDPIAHRSHQSCPPGRAAPSRESDD